MFCRDSIFAKSVTGHQTIVDGSQDDTLGINGTKHFGTEDLERETRYSGYSVALTWNNTTRIKVCINAYQMP